ncbi:MAG: alkaline phosphatase family protein [Bryobacterales bacterium]|nr:alkaline phosphatase family protein [Bryobacterales bacterium]
MKPRAVLIGLDGATFALLDPLMEEGVMPSLKALVGSGARGELNSVIPPLTPPAWTSLMTGRNPGNHGIFDFLRFEFRAGGRQLRVLDGGDVACPTVWSMLAGHGLRSTVLNFPMTFPVRQFEGSVVPGWVPWRHLRLASYPRTLYDRLSAAIPGFNPRELAMDMALEERALEGCHSEEDYENLIALHIRREHQWFEVARFLMREEPADLTAVLFDGVDKLQHFCWRFLDPSLFPNAPSAFESRVRQLCLEYYRAIDGFIGEIVEMSGDEARVFIASDHGFGPTVEVFHLNAWLHQHGYLTWAKASDIEQKHSETLGMGTMARRFYEIDWKNTTAYCPTPSSNGIYITPATADGAGVAPERYERFRRELADALLAFKDPATGQSPVTHIWTREEAFAGAHMSSAPDLTLSLRDGGLVSILPSGELVKPRSEITGAHRPNGVFVAAGRGIRQGVALPPLSILDVAPTLLYALGLPVSAEIEGRIPEQLFEAGHLRLHPPQFEAPVEDTTLLALAAQAVPNNNLDMEIMGQLRALGYME